MEIRDFISALQRYRGDNVFNPWAETDRENDGNESAPLVRSRNLLQYLELRKQADFIFVAEALGYQGGHFTGLAMTSERILLGKHREIPQAAVLGEDWRYERTSDPYGRNLKAKQRTEGFNEPTATVMWGVLSRHGISPFKAILWNIFPFHPYHGGDYLTNRTPDKEELAQGLKYAEMLYSLVPQAKIIAVGQKAAGTLVRAGIVCGQVPHPSMGGAEKFKLQVAELLL